MNHDFIMQNNARILSGFTFQPRHIPEHRQEEKQKPQESKLNADERRFLLCAWTYQYKLTLTEIYPVIGFSACKGTRIAKKLERNLLIKIFNIVKGKGISKYPVLLPETHGILDIEERKFEGKGCGYEHLIWQHLIAEHFKEQKAQIELNRGNKCIDIAFEHNGKLIAVEVAMTSAHERENIEKDVQMARADLVIIGCKDNKVLDEVNAIIKELGEDFRIKVKATLLSKVLNSDLEKLVAQ